MRSDPEPFNLVSTPHGQSTVITAKAGKPKVFDLLKTKRWVGGVTKPKLEILPGEPLDFGRKIPEAITKAFRGRGIHPAERRIVPDFQMQAARIIHAIYRFGHLPRSADPICGFVRRQTNAPIEQTPQGEVWRWLVRSRQRNS